MTTNTIPDQLTAEALDLLREDFHPAIPAQRHAVQAATGALLNDDLTGSIITLRYAATLSQWRPGSRRDLNDETGRKLENIASRLQAIADETGAWDKYQQRILDAHMKDAMLFLRRPSAA